MFHLTVAVRSVTPLDLTWQKVEAAHDEYRKGDKPTIEFKAHVGHGLSFENGKLLPLTVRIAFKVRRHVMWQLDGREIQIFRGRIGNTPALLKCELPTHGDVPTFSIQEQRSIISNHL